jgi:hypothetical protein
MDDLLLTEKADLRCTHLHSGVITVPASQDWVTIAGVPIPVEPDPVGRPVDKCQVPMNSNCKLTAGVTGGYSSLLRIGGKQVCLKSLVGPTIALPPGTFEVLDPGQDFVEEVK